MKDQAKSLKEMMNSQKQTARRPKVSGDYSAFSKVFTICSGKGGVGKTNFVLNTAVALARQSRKVLIIDADLGLANIDIMLGLAPKKNIQDVLEGRALIEEVILDGPEGIQILPAGSGVESLTSLNKEQQLFLLTQISMLEKDLDYILIDASAGISANVLYFSIAAQENIVITTPEPTALADGYALIKVLNTQYGIKRVHLVINMVASPAEAKKVYQKFTAVVDRFLNVNVAFLGYIPKDDSIPYAVREQKPFYLIDSQSDAAKCIHAISRRQQKIQPLPDFRGDLSFFWKKLFDSPI